MPITPTYPGIYIEELPSTSHTILAAPTWITAFVGYTHPEKGPQPTAVQAPPTAILLSCFADYREKLRRVLRQPLASPITSARPSSTSSSTTVARAPT